MGHFKCVFTKEQEDELVAYVKDMELRLFGLTTTDLRRLAYQLAIRNKLQHNFNTEKQLAGLDWLKGFFSRHTDLSLRKPEATSAARAMGFNEVSVGKFFDLLDSLMDRYNFQASSIYNVDELGLTAVPKTQSKVIALKGRRQVGTLTSAERGQLVTVELCMSAAGHYIPPLLVFPRVRMKAELLNGAPHGTIAACQPNGWMQTEIFVQWLGHFIAHVRPSKDKPVLLILDGHVTHTKNLDLIDLARKNGVIILCLPPHCTHKCQPLDVSFNSPLNQFYSQEVKAWLRMNPGRVVTQFQIASLFGRAYQRAATMQTAVHGFEKTGIYPTNRHVFTEADFVPSKTTDRPEKQNNPSTILQSEAVAGPSRINVQPLNNVHSNTQDETAMKSSCRSWLTLVSPSELNLQHEKTAGSSKILQPEAVAGPSGINLQLLNNIHSNMQHQIETTPESSPLKKTPEKNISAKISTDMKFLISPQDIMPIPHVNRKESQSKRRGKTVIITESPYQRELAETLSKAPNSVKRKSVKRNLTDSKSLPKKRAKVVSKKHNENITTKNHADNTFCFYCQEKYSETSKADQWIKCTKCNNWAHEGCTGWLLEELDTFECDICFTST